MNSSQELWTRTAPHVRSYVTDAVWQSTFANAVGLDLFDDTFVLGVSSGFAKSRVQDRYQPLVRQALSEAGHPKLKLRIDVLDIDAIEAELKTDAIEAELKTDAIDAELKTDAIDAELKTDAVETVRGAAGQLNPSGEMIDLRTTGEAGIRPDSVHPYPTSPPDLADNSAHQAPTSGTSTTPGQYSPPGTPGPEGTGRANSPGGAGRHAPNKYTFEWFVIGASNRFAHAAALSVAETPGQSYNPLFIHGGAGLGKTHLLRAIAHYVGQHYPNFLVRYVSTEAFLNEFVNTIRTNDQAGFKQRYREVDVLLIDDIQFIEGKEGLQEEFFHTFNTLHEADRQIIISSDRPPDAISTLEDRLRSRFKMGLITDIQPPDVETRLAILYKKAEQQPGAPVPDDVLHFIASNIDNNIRELEGALVRVQAWRNLNQRPITLADSEELLHDIVSQKKPRRISAQNIIDATAEMFGFTEEELKGKSRRRPLVTARQISMYVCRELTDLSYPQIGQEFGGRDHTTAIHAVSKVTDQLSEKHEIYHQVLELTRLVKGEA